MRTPIGLDALVARFPNSATVQRRQLAAALAVEDSARVRAGLQHLAELGYSPSAETLATLSRFVPEDELAALRLRFDANRTIVQASGLFSTVPAGGRLIESIAWDPYHRRLFASAVVGRELLYTDGESWRAVPGLHIGSPFGLAIDEPRRLLWIASGTVEQTPSPDSAFRGLIALDLDSLIETRRIAIAGGGSPLEIAVAAEGTVYAADSQHGTVWRLGVGDTEATIIVPAGRLQSPQGMVPSRDRRRLYVSDYGYGLALVDLNSGAVSRLPSDSPAMLDGIDGLVRYRNGLIAVQNGTNPRRILFLALSPDGRRITRTDILESGHPEWGEPTQGLIRDDQFLYVADAQWEAYGGGGAPTATARARPTAIRALALRGRGL